MKFECKSYGDCCRNLKQKNSERAAKFSSTGVLNLAMESGEIALPVFDWEVSRIRELARGYLGIKPLWIFLDHRGQPVVVMWSVNHEECPFLSESKCTIYKDRPSICRSFPVTSSGIIQVLNGEKNIDINSSQFCRCWNDAMPKTQATLSEMFRTAYGIFGDSYVGALKYDMQFVFAVKIIQDLANRGKVRQVYLDVRHAEKILSKGSIGFVDFLEREKIITRKDISIQLDNMRKEAETLVGLE